MKDFLLFFTPETASLCLALISLSAALLLIRKKKPSKEIFISAYGRANQ